MTSRAGPTSADDFRRGQALLLAGEVPDNGRWAVDEPREEEDRGLRADTLSL